MDSNMGMCMPWFEEDQTKSDCVVLDGCQTPSDCCNKGFMCAHFEGREAGRCMPWLENACVDGYGCQENSECCQMNYICLHSVGKEFGTCMPIMSSNASDAEKASDSQVSSAELQGDSEYCKPGCEACCDEDKGSQFGGFHCMPLSEKKGMCMPWFEGGNDLESDDGCTPGCEACCHSSGSRYEKHCVKRPGSDRGSCQHWLMKDEEVQDLKPGCLMAGEKGCKTSHDCCGVTGSLDGLVCHRDTGVCHPLLPNPYPLPPFSPLSSEESKGVSEISEEESAKAENTCIHGYGCQSASECCQQHYQCLHTVGKEFGTCMPWLP